MREEFPNEKDIAMINSGSTKQSSKKKSQNGSYSPALGAQTEVEAISLWEGCLLTMGKKN